MLFNSFEFLIFFPIVFIIYWVLNNDLKKQNVLLLISSYIFYAWWDWRFLSLIIISSLIDFTVGSKIFTSKTLKQKKNWLIVSLIANLGLLSFFKYFNIFVIDKIIVISLSIVVFQNSVKRCNSKEFLLFIVLGFDGIFGLCYNLSCHFFNFIYLLFLLHVSFILDDCFNQSENLCSGITASVRLGFSQEDINQSVEIINVEILIG